MESCKYDVHVHTAEVSSCGKVMASELVRLYREAGYCGVVITDHYYDGFFNSLGDIGWEEKVDRFLLGFHIAREEGEKIGLSVIPGIEIRFTENPNDYLVYGVDEAFLKDYKELYKIGLSAFKKLAEGKGLLVYQAHPFRPGMVPVDPACLDGVEVFNGNPRHNSRNHEALAFALKHHLKMISGSDFHQGEDLAKGGIIIPERIISPPELVDLLKNDRISGLIGLDEEV